jgi:hypothetical protein
MLGQQTYEGAGILGIAVVEAGVIAIMRTHMRPAT